MRNLSYLSPKTAVKPSPIHGKGLFAVRPIKKGEIVAVKGGYIFDSRTLRKVQQSVGPAEIQLADDLHIGLYTKAQKRGGMIFSNHSCEPTIGVQGQIVFVALRDIKAGEELTHDWATTDDGNYELNCRCGAATCRKKITGKDWRRKDLQKKYRGYFSWYLEQKINRTR
jgi:SET domain-containing protein